MRRFGGLTIKRRLPIFIMAKIFLVMSAFLRNFALHFMK